MSSFQLHPRLAAGAHYLGAVSGCQVLLKDNAHYPWLLIVPEVGAEVEDLHQLEVGRYGAVLQLVREASLFVSSYFQPDKLNVACLGNEVRQLHVHVLGRSEGDAAWPGTVWANRERIGWEIERVAEIRAAAAAALGLC